MSKKYDRGPYGKNVYGRGTIRFAESAPIVILFEFYANLQHVPIVFGPVNFNFTIHVGGGDTLYMGRMWVPNVPDDGPWVPDSGSPFTWIPDVPSNGPWEDLPHGG